MVLLAPVVKGRKGHYRELFESIARQGFERVRVDGELREITDGMKLDRYKHARHRGGGRPARGASEGLRPRLAASRGDGALARRGHARRQRGPALGRDRRRGRAREEEGRGGLGATPGSRDVLFSRHLVDPEIGAELRGALAPTRSRSTRPYGACPDVRRPRAEMRDRPGARDPEPDKTIAQGGVAALGKPRDMWAFSQVGPWPSATASPSSSRSERSPTSRCAVLLEGAGEEQFEIEYTYKGRKVDVRAPLPGRLRPHQARFETSTTAGQRKWAEAFMRLMPCRTCGGGRLRPRRSRTGLAG